MENNNNETTLDINIDDLFNDPEETTQTDKQEEKSNPQNEEMTKAVSERINTVRKKAESETENRVAKELGYESYEDLRKANEKKLLKDAGLDENDTELMSVLEKVVEKRISEDPRMKKLEDIEANEKTRFVSAQLKEINELIGNKKYTSLNDLPKETLDLWQKIGNLKQAFLATQGDSLLIKQKSNINNGSLSHLADSSAGKTGVKTRLLTQEEIDIYKLVDPDLTDEELSKKTINID